MIRPWVVSAVVALTVVAGALPVAAAPLVPVAQGGPASGSLALLAPPEPVVNGEPGRVALRAVTTVDAEITWSIHDAVCSRSEFTLSLDGGELGDPIAGSAEPMAVAAGSEVLPILQVDVPAAVQPCTEVSDSGVVPMLVELRAQDSDSDTPPLDDLLVHLTMLPAVDDGIRPLAVAPYFEVSLPVALQPDGSYAIDPGERADMLVLAEALSEQADIDATLTITPESLAGLDSAGGAENAAVIDALSATVANPRDGETRQLQAAPYVRIDEASWWVDGLDDLLAQQYVEGAAALEQTLGVTPSTDAVVLDATATGETVEQFRARGARYFVVADNHLSAVPASTGLPTLTQRFWLRARGGARVPAAVIDAGMTERFGAGPLEAHRFLTELTILYFDQPNISRGVVVAPPPGWQPSDAFLRPLLTGLRNNPLLAPVTLDEFFAPGRVSIATNGSQGAPSAAALTRRLVPATAESTNGYLGAHSLFSAGLDSYASILGADDIGRIEPLRDLLLVSGSNDLDDQQRSRYFTALNTTVSSDVALVDGPEPETITLTSRRGEIPITIVNNMGFSANVVLVLESDKLVFPEGSELPWTLREGVNDDITLPVEARASGDSLLQITVRSPDLRLQLGNTSRVTVRSTALSGLGVVISIVALLMLVTWWIRQARRSRRERAATASATGHGAIET